MTRLQYVLVAAGAVEKESFPTFQWKATIEPGHLVFVKPSSQAFWRGAPVPVVHPITSEETSPPEGTTLLGVLSRVPVVAGSNFGVPLAVLTIIVQGAAELRSDAVIPVSSDALKTAKWHACGNRHIFHSGSDSPTERRIVIR